MINIWTKPDPFLFIHHVNRTRSFCKWPECLSLTSLDSLPVGPSSSEYSMSFPPRNSRSRYSSRNTAERDSCPWWPLKTVDLLVDSRSAARAERRAWARTSQRQGRAKRYSWWTVIIQYDIIELPCHSVSLTNVKNYQRVDQGLVGGGLLKISKTELVPYISKRETE